MPNQSEKQTLFQIKMVKIFAPFQAKMAQKPYLSTSKPWGRTYLGLLPNLRKFSPGDFKETPFHSEVKRVFRKLVSDCG